MYSRCAKFCTSKHVDAKLGAWLIVTKMEPQLADHLFREGATLVLLDVPQGTEIGIDYNFWSVGPKFKGIKMIPSGIHFVYYSAVSKDGTQTAPRTGFFHWFQPKELLVQCWDPAAEELTDRGVDDALIERLRSNLMELDQFLGPYPHEQLKKWLSLSNHITLNLISRIQPENGHISSVTRVETDNTEAKDNSHSTSEATPTTEASTGCGYFAGVGQFPEVKTRPPVKVPLLSLTPQKEATLRFSAIPRLKHPEGATPTEVTRCNMDLSYTLDSIISSSYQDNDPLNILGELQIAFICFMIGQVYEAFEQWKSLVKVMCFSERALCSRSLLFVDFISVLHFQLKEIPEDFFIDIVTRNNFLTATLQVFFHNVAEGERLDQQLMRRAEQFRINLTKRFKWDFTSEPEDESPTLVVLEETKPMISSDSR